ncbi:hypothetical protein KPP03845_100670 [Streptomyces xanthophaeus]|uniref:hypothetical protein n=1 Tax=Streptomyces xanthophaeus TaxID=67385 RepID=UPI00233F52D9|nr:hypothetical protein [Streptomyces xanthophaeus]WCD84348.1 hypothetical protein KPP03845_100670 [Streptomyces xanthophaeus]
MRAGHRRLAVAVEADGQLADARLPAPPFCDLVIATEPKPELLRQFDEAPWWFTYAPVNIRL